MHLKLLHYILLLIGTLGLFSCNNSGSSTTHKIELSNPAEACSISAELDQHPWRGQCHTLHANHIGNQLIIGYDCTDTNNLVKGMMFNLSDFKGKGVYTFSDTTDGKITLVNSKYQSYILTYLLDDSLTITKYSANHLKAHFKLKLVNSNDRSDTLNISTGKITIHEEKGNCTINRML